jgi:hypothetical protein
MSSSVGASLWPGPWRRSWRAHERGYQAGIWKAMNIGDSVAQVLFELHAARLSRQTPRAGPCHGPRPTTGPRNAGTRTRPETGNKDNRVRHRIPAT